MRRLPPPRERLDAIRVDLQALGAALDRHARELDSSPPELNLVLDSMDDAVIAVDADGTVLRVNAAAATMLGRPADALRGAALRTVVAPEWVEAAERVMRTLAGGEHFETLPLGFTGASGPQAPRTVRVRKVRQTSGRDLVILLAGPPGDRLDAAAHLAESPLVLYTVSLALGGALTYVSPNIRTIFGTPAADCVADPTWWRSRLHPDEQERLVQELTRKSFEPGRHTHEYRFRFPDGGYHWIRDDFKLVRDAAGEPREIIGAWIDVTERKVQDDRLAHYAALIRSTSDAVVSVDPTRLIQTWNPAAERLFGYTSAEIIGQPYTMLAAPAAARDAARAERKLVTGEATRGLDTLAQRKDGTTFPVALTVSPMLGRDGSFKGTVVVARDISARIAAEDRLRSSEARLKHLLKSSPVVIYTRRPTAPFDITYISENVREILGYGQEEFQAEPGFCRALVHPDDMARIMPAVQALGPGGRGTYEARWLAPDGAWRWYQDEVRVVTGDDGAPAELVGSLVDITPRKDVEERLRAGEERFRAVYTQSEDAILVIAQKGLRVVDANPKSAQLFGRPLDELVGMAVAALVDAEDPRYQRHIASDWSTAALREQTFIRADGSRFEGEASTSPLRGLYGERLFSVILRDVSVRLEHERVLKAAKQAAEAANRAKSSFLANMSHELRTPLNAIIGFSELLETQHFGPLNERQADYVREVLESGHHLLALLNDILDISKIEAGRMTLAREMTHPEPVIEAVLSAVQPLADKQGVVLSSDVQDPLPNAWLDTTRLRQILYNLLSNGIKFTPAGGTVHLTGSSDGDFLAIGVTDTGIGISQEDLPRLFKLFERLDRKGEGPEGTGLGLTLTRRLVELHGGSVEVSSEPGVGSTFTVYLPLRERVPITELTGPIASEGPAVLVVEDDPRAAELIAGELRSAGLGVAVTCNGAEALAMAEQLRPVAITLDILMPGTDGWEVLAQLKSSPITRDIPVIIVSIVDEPRRGVVLGADEYLMKPLPPGALHQALTRVGIDLHGVEGVRVCLLDTGNADLDRIEGELRRAGCIVERREEFTPEMIAELKPDVGMVDLTHRPSLAIAFTDALEAAGQRTPVIALVAEDGGTSEQWRADTLELAATRAVAAPDQLVRLIHRIRNGATARPVSGGDGGA